MNPEIWVVIVTFNAQKWIGNCLDSVTQSSVKLKTIVIDNNSNDETIEILKKNYKEVHLISNSKNEGFGSANNIGISYALNRNAEFIILLNQDAKVAVDTVHNLLEYSKIYPSFGILSPMFYSYDGSLLDPYLLKWIYNFDLELASDIFFGRPKDYYEVNLMPAAFWMIRREALICSGGFDPMFFMYGEDDDLWRRMKYRGWKVGFFPKTFVYHQTSKNNYSLQKRLWYSNANTLLELKNFNKPFWKCFLDVFRLFLKNILCAIISLNKSELYVQTITFKNILFRLFIIKKNRNLSMNGRSPYLTLKS
jgi:GT2 family glycosyltransferase